MAFVPSLTWKRGQRLGMNREENTSPNRAGIVMHGGSTSRRKVLRLGAMAIAGMLGTKLSDAAFVALSEEARLPNGARQFSSVVSAQRQWGGLPSAFADGRTPDDKEWENIRVYLRAVYGVGDDMKFLTKTWRGERRSEGTKLIQTFRKAVRDLDKPAAAKDVSAFLDGHSRVVGLFDDFFNQLKGDSVGDMPSEL